MGIILVFDWGEAKALFFMGITFYYLLVVLVFLFLQHNKQDKYSELSDKKKALFFKTFEYRSQ